MASQTYEWARKRFLRRASALRPDVRRAWLRGLRTLRDTLPEDLLARVLRRGGIEEMIAERLSPAEIDRMFTEFRGSVRGVVEQSGKMFARDIPAKGVGVLFNTLSPSVANAVSSVTLRVMTPFKAQVMQTIRDATRFGLEMGWSPQRTAGYLRDVLPLAPNQQDAIANFRGLLETNSREALTRRLRDRRFDGTLRRALGPGGKGLTVGQIDRMTKAYAARMVAHNAKVIADTATLQAMRKGQQQVWSDALDRGDVPAVYKTWNTTLDGRAREEHMRMHKEQVALKELYSNGEMVPGESTFNCRCVETYSTVRRRGRRTMSARTRPRPRPRTTRVEHIQALKPLPPGVRHPPNWGQMTPGQKAAWTKRAWKEHGGAPGAKPGPKPAPAPAPTGAVPRPANWDQMTPGQKAAWTRKHRPKTKPAPATAATAPTGVQRPANWDQMSPGQKAAWTRKHGRPTQAVTAPAGPQRPSNWDQMTPGQKAAWTRKHGKPKAAAAAPAEEYVLPKNYGKPIRPEKQRFVDSNDYVYQDTYEKATAWAKKELGIDYKYHKFAAEWAKKHGTREITWTVNEINRGLLEMKRLGYPLPQKVRLYLSMEQSSSIGYYGGTVVPEAGPLKGRLTKRGASYKWSPEASAAARDARVTGKWKFDVDEMGFSLDHAEMGGPGMMMHWDDMSAMRGVKGKWTPRTSELARANVLVAQSTWFQGVAWRQAMHHEMGHRMHLYHMMQQARKGQFVPPNKIAWGINSVERPLSYVEKTMLKRHGIGGYALQDSSEFVAEIFSGAISGRTYHQEVWDLYYQFAGPPIRGRVRGPITPVNNQIVAQKHREEAYEKLMLQATDDEVNLHLASADVDFQDLVIAPE